MSETELKAQQAAVAAGVSDLADDEDAHGKTPGDYFRMGYRAARNEVIEECACKCEGDFDSEMKSYGEHFAFTIRSLKKDEQT